jgi:hypothetical protein
MAAWQLNLSEGWGGKPVPLEGKSRKMSKSPEQDNDKTRWDMTSKES